MRKKVLSILIAMFALPFAAILIFIFYSRQQAAVGDPQVLLGRIGNERIYRKDLDEIISRKSIRDADQAWDALTDESLRLQYGAVAGLFALNDTSFDYPNKNYAERLKLLEKVQDSTKLPTFTISYATHTMYYDDSKRTRTTELINEYSRAYIKQSTELIVLQPILKEYIALGNSNSGIPVTTTYMDADLLDPLTPNLYAQALATLNEGQPSSPIYFKSTDVSGSVTNGVTVITLISRKTRESQSGEYYFDKFKEFAKVTKYEI